MKRFTNGLLAATFLCFVSEASASTFSLDAGGDSGRDEMRRATRGREHSRRAVTHHHSRIGRHHHPMAPPSQPAPAPQPLPVSQPLPVFQPLTGGPTLIVSDGIQTMRLSNASGVMSFSGALGKFAFTITTSAATGLSLLPSLTLHSLSYSGLTPGQLTISLSRTSVNPLDGAVTSKINGQISGGSLSYATYVDMANNLFGKGALLNNQGAFSTSSFAGTASAALSPHSPFSLTEMIIIQEAFRGTTTFGTMVIDPPRRVVPVPETGSSLALLSLALLGIEVVRRRLRAG
jgi:hypothetical protein